MSELKFDFTVLNKVIYVVRLFIMNVVKFKSGITISSGKNILSLFITSPFCSIVSLYSRYPLILHHILVSTRDASPIRKVTLELSYIPRHSYDRIMEHQFNKGRIPLSMANEK